MGDPSNIYAIDDLKFLTGYNIEPVVASETAIREAIERYYAEKGPRSTTSIGELRRRRTSRSTEDDDEIDVDELEKAAEDAPVVKLVNLILSTRSRRARRDIHIEPYEKELPRPLPHRRRALRGDAAAAEAARTRSPRASEDHGRARHRRAPPAAGRPHQAQDRRRQGDGLPRLASARRCSARRSCCASSTSRTCSST